MNENAPQKNAPDLLERESSWLYMTLASALCGFALFIAGLIWTYAAYETPEEFSRRFDVLYRGALIGAALVTFFTVVWRGLVSTRQVDAQTQQLTLIRRQLEHAEAQSSLNERNELAKLLQKGAELLDSEHQAHRYAGMSTLDFVATQNRDFAQQATDLLGEKYERAAKENYESRDTEWLRELISRSYRRFGRRAQVDIRLVADYDDDRDWVFVEGFKTAWYLRGSASIFNNEESVIDWGHLRFVEVKFYDLEINITRYFRKCTFTNCNVKSVHRAKVLSSTFDRCDFSNCVFFVESKIKGTGNVYMAGSPPRLKSGEPVSSEWLAANFVAIEE